MRRRALWGTAVCACLLAVVVGGLVLLPGLLYPPLTDAELRAVPGAEARIQLQQAQAQLQNNLRSTVVQMTAGLLVIGGAGATWWQVHVNREGLITERFTHAVDQVGSDNPDVRTGGIYALERIARNSPADRNTVQFILSAFVRRHAPWHADVPDGPEHPTEVVEERPWLHILAPDIHAAVGVLARRLPSTDSRRALPGGVELHLSRVDLRGLQLCRGRLVSTQLRHTNLARSWLWGTQLDRSDLTAADLRGCNLEETSFVDASLNHAYLSGANLRGANLRRASLCGADLRDANLDHAVLADARADMATIWPVGFEADRLHAVGVRSCWCPGIAAQP